MRVTRFLIHVGPQKTGSSFIQSSLIYLRARLLADGISYPEDWNDYDKLNHKGLVWQLRDKAADKLRTLFDGLRDSGHETVIISCEGLYGVDNPGLHLLRDSLGDAPSEIVFYCRRWSERIPSIWNQGTRMGEQRTLPEFLQPCFDTPMATPKVNYAQTWERFSGIFGREAVRIVSLDNIREAGGDVTRHFLRDLVGWHADYTVPPEALANNFSSGTADTEIVRVLNKLRTRAHGWSDERMADTFFKRRETLDLTLLEAAIGAATRVLPLNDADERFAPAWEAINAWSDRLVGEPGDLMFKPRIKNAEYADTKYLTKPGIMAAYKAAYEALGGDAVPLLPLRRKPKSERDAAKQQRIAERAEKKGERKKKRKSVLF